MIYLLLIVLIIVLILIYLKLREFGFLNKLLSYDASCPAFPKNVMANIYDYLRHNPMTDSVAYAETFKKMQELNRRVTNGEITFEEAQQIFDMWQPLKDKEYNEKEYFAWKEKYIDSNW